MYHFRQYLTTDQHDYFHTPPGYSRLYGRTGYKSANAVKQAMEWLEIVQSPDGDWDIISVDFDNVNDAPDDSAGAEEGGVA